MHRSSSSAAARSGSTARAAAPGPWAADSARPGPWPCRRGPAIARRRPAPAPWRTAVAPRPCVRPAATQLLEVEPVELPVPGRARAERALEHRLREGPEREGVGGADEMDGRAHDRDAHRSPLQDELLQLARNEARHARPQTDIGLLRDLRLHAHEVLDHRERGHGDAARAGAGGPGAPGRAGAGSGPDRTRPVGRDELTGSPAIAPAQRARRAKAQRVPSCRMIADDEHPHQRLRR